MSNLNKTLHVNPVEGFHSIRTDLVNGKLISSLSIHYDFILPDNFEAILKSIQDDAEKVANTFKNQLLNSEI